jgi:hypothetical protein
MHRLRCKNAVGARRAESGPRELRRVKTFALLGWALVIGAAAGILLDVATFLVARYGPQADSWSFRGNGALAVPFGLGPAILAGGWTALVLRYRGAARWLVLGVAAGLVGIGFVLLGVLVLVLFGSAAGGALSNALTLLTLGWMVVAPLLARFVHAPADRVRRGQLGGHVMAGALFAITLGVVFSVSGLVLAPGS